MRFHILVLFSFLLPACGSLVDVPVVEEKQAITIPEDSKPAPFGLFKVKLSIPRGSENGAYSPRSLFCNAPWGTLTTQEVTSQLENNEIRRGFNRSMESLGYDVTHRTDLLFDEDEEDDILRTLYKVSANIKDIKLDVCDQGFAGDFMFTRGTKGEAYMKVEWGVYDSLRRKTVYKVVTEGYSNLKRANNEGIGVLLDDTFAAAAHNLGSDAAFHDLIVNGIMPSDTPDHNKREIYTDADPVYLDSKPLSKTPLTKHMEQSRKAAVLVSAGVGHGSGFFISKEGHILTNQHVVGSAEKVRIETAGKKAELIGTVLRRNKVRDVALIKLDDLPDDLDIVTLPLRKDWPKVGEDVYAIGTPLSRRKLQDTVTRGIISAHRKDFRIFGTRVNLLQADVTIHGGNSGGPLLDANGNIVGITVASRIYGVNNPADGLNYFIPIGEALGKLDIYD